MSPLFPTQSCLSEVFGISSPFPKPASRSPPPLSSPIFSSWSVAEDVKTKGAQLSDAATAEFEKASAKAQAKAGKIELYSAKYYAACTVGGILACVWNRASSCLSGAE